jgi:hypothetical protein
MSHKELLMNMKFSKMIFATVFLISLPIVAQEPQQSSPINVFLRSLPRHSIVDATSLSLYKFLDAIHTNLMKMIQGAMKEKNNKATTALVAAYTTTEKAQELLKDIINDFNDYRFSYNPDIEMRFRTLCDYFDQCDFTDMEPWRLRSFNKSVQEFDEYITVYCMERKQFLCKEDVSLFEKISALDHILMLGIVRADYFDIKFSDKILDWTVCRPWEFMCDHPWLTASVIGISAALFAYYLYTRPYTYTNENPKYTVSQTCGVPQRGGATCGYYALLHALIERNAKTPDEAQALIQKARSMPDLLKPWMDSVTQQRKATQKESDQKSSRKVKSDEVGAGWVDSNNISNILETPVLVQQVTQPLFADGRKVETDHIVVTDRIPGVPTLIATSAGVTAEDSEHAQEAGLLQGISDSAMRFGTEGQHPEHIVLCFPGSSGRGHWAMVQITHNPQAQNQVEAHIIDSIPENRWGNRTGSHYITALLDFFTRLMLPAAQQTAKKQS